MVEDRPAWPSGRMNQLLTSSKGMDVLRVGRGFQSQALLTVVCFYLAGWQFTKTNGVASLAEVTGWTGWSPSPFVVTVDISNNIHVERQYHHWLFGRSMRLPVHRQFREPNPIVIGGVQPLVIIQPNEEEQLLGIPDP